jgi:hypothetical protein
VSSATDLYGILPIVYGILRIHVEGLNREKCFNF